MLLPIEPLLQRDQTSVVFIMCGGEKHRIPNPDTLNALRIDNSNVLTLDDLAFDNIPIGPIMPSLDWPYIGYWKTLPPATKVPPIPSDSEFCPF